MRLLFFLSRFCPDHNIGHSLTYIGGNLAAQVFHQLLGLSPGYRLKATGEDEYSVGELLLCCVARRLDNKARIDNPVDHGAHFRIGEILDNGCRHLLTDTFNGQQLFLVSGHQLIQVRVMFGQQSGCHLTHMANAQGAEELSQ